MKPVAAILALQGAFAEMEAFFAAMGFDTFEIRRKGDLGRDFDFLVLPGGESTVQRKLLAELGILDVLKRRIEDGVPVFATCAGLILLAEKVDGGESAFAALPASVGRNAYGRQLGSFATKGEWNGIPGVPMTFIRAPAILSVSPGVEVLSSGGGRPTSVRYGSILAFAWHPELDMSNAARMAPLCRELAASWKAPPRPGRSASLPD